MNGKVVTISKNTRCVHVETDLGIVNIWVNLRNVRGERTEYIEVLPNRYAGEPAVICEDYICAVRLIEPIEPVQEVR